MAEFDVLAICNFRCVVKVEANDLDEANATITNRLREFIESFETAAAERISSVAYPHDEVAYQKDLDSVKEMLNGPSRLTKAGTKDGKYSVETEEIPGK